jgi:A/G-specific adenine glycosylase
LRKRAKEPPRSECGPIASDEEERGNLGAPERAGDVDRDRPWVANVGERLLAWYAEARRDLPWRTDRDAYRILVSELMLVQTTVAAVIPYFERFLSRFPNPEALAAADESEVLKAWEGLGYYRRARQLHAAARVIVREHGGAIPDDPAAVRALPGVGRYIAGAILSFAFDRPEPIVEANSQRVLARLLAVRQDLKLASTRERIWDAARRIVPRRDAGKFNQALMDLGALVCTPREPACLVCPLLKLCEARRLGLQDRLPVTTPKPAPEAVTEACAVVVRDGQVLVVQRGRGGLWEEFWEFPTVHVSGADPAGRPATSPTVDLAEGIRMITGSRVRSGPPVKMIRYSVTKHRVELFVHLARALSATLKPGPGHVDARWVAPGALGEYTFSSAGRRVIAWINQNPAALLADF